MIQEALSSAQNLISGYLRSEAMSLDKVFCLTDKGDNKKGIKGLLCVIFNCCPFLFSK